MRGNRVRAEVFHDTSFNYVVYIVYKRQGPGHYKISIPRIDGNSRVVWTVIGRFVIQTFTRLLCESDFHSFSV